MWAQWNTWYCLSRCKLLTSADEATLYRKVKILISFLLFLDHYTSNILWRRVATLLDFLVVCIPYFLCQGIFSRRHGIQNFLLILWGCLISTFIGDMVRPIPVILDTMIKGRPKSRRIGFIADDLIKKLLMIVSWCLELHEYSYIIQFFPPTTSSPVGF